MTIAKGFIRKYMGGFTSEEDAGRQYDKYAVCLRGAQASLNFSYTQRQILELLEEEKGKTPSMTTNFE